MMDYKHAIKDCLLFLLVTLHLCLAARHSLHYITTGVTPGAGLPEYTMVGLLDGEQFVYYDNNITKLIPKAEWMKTVDADDPDYWKTQTQKQEDAQEIFKANLKILMQRFNQIEGVHTLQRFSGCDLDEDSGTKRGYFQFGYDGEDLLSLDLSTGTWTAAVPQAEMTKRKWEDNGDVQFRKNYLENVCTEWLEKYVSYGRSTLERKVPPEVSLFQKDSSSPVVCHATGFFPKSVLISWQKNGEDLYEDVDFRETLPNQDRTFQQRSLLKVSPEELDKYNYTCVVQHISLEKDLVLQASERRVLSGDSDGMTLAIIGAVVAVLLLVCLVGYFIWKKKNPGFRPVSGYPRASSD